MSDSFNFSVLNKNTHTEQTEVRSLQIKFFLRFLITDLRTFYVIIFHGALNVS